MQVVDMPPILRLWAGGLLRRFPLGRRLKSSRMKAAIANGRIQPLVPIEPLRRVFIAVARDVDLASDGPLTYFEAGVYAGQSLALWHQVASELEIETRSFGADSFQGLPSSVESDEGNWHQGAFACPREVTEWNLRRLNAPVDRIRLVEGWFSETMTAELAAEVGTVHVAMIDADAYSSTVPVLEFIGPLLHDPAYLIFDDWFQGGNYDVALNKSRGTGVERAFNEWLEANTKWTVEPVDTYEHREFGLAGQVLKLGASVHSETSSTGSDEAVFLNNPIQ